MTAKPYRLWHFNGGLHLPAHKAESTRLPIAAAKLSKRLVLPLQQHIGIPAEPVVEVGDAVLKGQMIARATEYVSVPIHAPSSGVVVGIRDELIPHPSGLAAPCIVIETDGKDEWVDLPEPRDYRELDPSALRNRIREAGIVGLGGAGFPTFIKLNPGTHKVVDTLVLNAAECEPYITCDDMLMRERPEQIIRGAQIMAHALHAHECIIGIEDNKPQAYEALLGALGGIDDDRIHVVRVPTIYPTGGEKQLIKILIGKEVPSNGLPLDVGVVCHNVATAAAVDDALQHSQPLISRIVTITGGGVKEPRNLEVLIGTPIRDLTEECGGYADDAKRLIMGGPMMGFTLSTDLLPVIKTTNCILVANTSEAPDPPPAMPCIRCGACSEVCPAQLLPQQLYWHSRAKEFDKVQDYNLFDCIECGCCAYVCPSHIPLVQYYRYAKTEIWAQEREKQKSDLARRRHEFHVARLEREKTEREERMRQKKAALKKTAGTEATEDPKKAAIQAALERARAKQAGAAAEPRNVDNLTDAQKQQIEEVDRRRARPDQQVEANAEIDSEKN
jgi:electron transport complex protein RnfC